MAIIHPFRAVRPRADIAAQVASVPYDVVNSTEAAALAGGNAVSFLHVSRPEIDLPEGTNIYADEVYAKARENYDKLKADGALVTDPEPSLYLYRLIMDGREQIGIVAACAVDDYDNDIIKKHEKTRRDKEDDRTRHIMTLRSQTGPVFLTYRNNSDIDEMVLEATAQPPLYDFTAPDGVQHTIWRVGDAVRYVNAFHNIPALYIADGHHRAASASRARAACRDANADHTGDEEYNSFLAVIFPDDQLQILPYNRVVHDLHGQSADEFLAAVVKRFRVVGDADPSPAAPGNWSMYLGGRWYGLSLPDDFDRPADVVAALDVSILQDNLLDPVLDIKDVRTDKRIDFVGGIRGTGELERLVEMGQAEVAFSLFPTTIHDLISVSDAGSIMPPKSTWFEPKLRDALLIHEI
ncbi:MAG: DUF1015 family protein [Pyrinomonadaceae bacterium]